ncbi:hypothetical protein EVG20_g7612, partial [Dentipellis fragilis]
MGRDGSLPSLSTPTIHPSSTRLPLCYYHPVLKRFQIVSEAQNNLSRHTHDLTQLMPNFGQKSGKTSCSLLDTRFPNFPCIRTLEIALSVVWLDARRASQAGGGEDSAWAPKSSIVIMPWTAHSRPASLSPSPSHRLTMRRPPSLALDAESSPASPDISTIKLAQEIPESSTQEFNTPTPNADIAYSAPAPSIRLLFSLLSTRDLLTFVLPAFIASLVAGGIAPFMTYVVGQVFNTFAGFPLSGASSADKAALLRGVGLCALELVGLAAGALALSSITSCLWIWTGERNTMILRQKVYESVSARDMVWFDTKMGADDSVQTTEGDGPVGAGGLMAKFARETDEVRMASSLASGMIVQYLTTCIACLVLGFLRSWALTLVILSAVPLLMFIQGVSQGIAGPILAVERQQTAQAATLVDRAVSAIATVKAFNAQLYEERSFFNILEKIRGAARRCNTVWGFTSGLAQFVMMAMFVQGFWFGAKLVRSGHVAAGDVMAVFWACLIATTNLQMCIPQFITLAKGKFAMSSLIGLIEQPTPEPAPVPSPVSSVTLGRRPSIASHVLVGKRGAANDLRMITPSRCFGELALSDVTFAYPSRPSAPVLREVSLYLPARETTFIVGGSGSGKSTVAQLLLRMYATQEGTVSLDDQDMAYLDPSWTRAHVGVVSQGCILFDGTVHENVAMGLAAPGSTRSPEDATREEVIDACRVALMHEFVRDLPDGYDTPLGNGGANLSGGQKQRLAIARARLRDPTVLILDEATSALDATSRILVFEAIKRWRTNKTTIVITHDLSQITANDFVYVLKDGRVAEQGYRADLEKTTGGEFRAMMDVQNAGDWSPESNEDPWSDEMQAERAREVEMVLEEQDRQRDEEKEWIEGEAAALKHRSMVRPAPTLRPLTVGNWMLDVVADLTRSRAASPTPTDNNRISRFIPTEAFGTALKHGHEDDDANSEEYEMEEGRARRPSTVAIGLPSLPMPAAARTTMTRRRSLQFSPTSPVFSTNTISSSTVFDDVAFDEEKKALERSATMATHKRFYAGETSPKRVRTRWDTATLTPLKEVKVSTPEPAPTAEINNDEKPLPFISLIRCIYPTIPHKPLVLLGVLFSAGSGAMTPLFSFLLSRLLFEVSIGAHNIGTINMFGGIVLAVAAADGLLMGLKYITMETAAMTWVTRVRSMCFSRILAQDKAWFDKTENSASRMVQVLVKDGDDARSLIATVLSQAVVVGTMLSVGLVWALVEGWQLTLLGFAIAPVFAVTMAVQTNLVAKCEVRNKRAREQVAKEYYDTISNIRGIRQMGFESVFVGRFTDAVESALHSGVRGAFVEGCTHGVASGLIYLAEALLFYVGAVLVANGTYTYLRMVQVLNLVVFTVSIGSQLMAFTNRIAKSVQATRDFNVLMQLPTTTSESHGTQQPPITTATPISFSSVSFAYPSRPDVPVLKNI